MYERFRSVRTRALIAGIALAAVGAGGVMVAISGRGSAAHEVTSVTGADVRFTYFDGEPGTLADFAGRPLVLNFWASWCPPCLAEMPDFEEVHQQLKGEVAFLGLNLQDDLAAAQRLADQTGVTYPLAADPEGAIFRRFGGIAMPTTVLIDADGEVVEVHAGVIFADDLAELIGGTLLDS
ncbi:hypothetical protein BH24ACT7_BH24ACT7_00210 [soil metagenome]